MGHTGEHGLKSGKPVALHKPGVAGHDVARRKVDYITFGKLLGAHEIEPSAPHDLGGGQRILPHVLQHPLRPDIGDHHEQGIDCHKTNHHQRRDAFIKHGGYRGGNNQQYGGEVGENMAYIEFFGTPGDGIYHIAAAFSHTRQSGLPRQSGGKVGSQVGGNLFNRLIVPFIGHERMSVTSRSDRRSLPGSRPPLLR